MAEPQDNHTLARAVVETDHQLEERRNRSLEELARHRWHWTLDETNPDRVSIREYARQIGRNYTTVYATVTGYTTWTDRGTAISLSESMERSLVGAEKETVIDAVAKAEGVGFESARKRHEEVREVRTIAQERAERRGTTVEEEAPRVAEERVRARESGQRRAEERRSRRSLRYIEIEGDLAAAQRRLAHALQTAQDVGWEQEEIELLTDSIAKVRAVLNLLDLRLSGETNVDWDSELANLTGEDR